MKTIDYEDLLANVGADFGVSAWRSINQQTIQAFADVTDDHQWIHVDVARAARELGGTISHGFLTLSLLPVMSAEMLRISGVRRELNYGLDKLRFTGAVPSGARIRLRQKLAAVGERAGGIAYTCDCEIEVQDQPRPALVCSWVRLVFA